MTVAGRVALRPRDVPSTRFPGTTDGSSDVGATYPYGRIVGDSVTGPTLTRNGTFLGGTPAYDFSLPAAPPGSGSRLAGEAGPAPPYANSAGSWYAMMLYASHRSDAKRSPGAAFYDGFTYEASHGDAPRLGEAYEYQGKVKLRVGHVGEPAVDTVALGYLWTYDWPVSDPALTPPNEPSPQSQVDTYSFEVARGGTFNTGRPEYDPSSFFVVPTNLRNQGLTFESFAGVPYHEIIAIAGETIPLSTVGYQLVARVSPPAAPSELAVYARSSIVPVTQAPRGTHWLVWRTFQFHQSAPPPPPAVAGRGLMQARRERRRAAFDPPRP